MKVIYSLMIALAAMLAACGDKAPNLPKLAATDVVVAFGRGDCAAPEERRGV